MFAEKLSGFRKTLSKKYGYELEYLDAPILIEKKEDLPFLLGTDEKEANEKFEYLKKKALPDAGLTTTTESTIASTSLTNS